MNSRLNSKLVLEDLPHTTSTSTFGDDKDQVLDPVIAALPEPFQKYALTPAQSAKKFSRKEDQKNEMNYKIDDDLGIKCAAYTEWSWGRWLKSWIPIVGWFFSTSITVPRGSVGLVLNRGKPEFLAPGYHILLDPWSSYLGERSLTPPQTQQNQPTPPARQSQQSEQDRQTRLDRQNQLDQEAGERAHIQHGTAHIISVAEGQLACILDTKTGKYFFLTQGIHVLESPTVVFKRLFTDISGLNIQVDKFRFERVAEGNKGVGTDINGKIKMYECGLHQIPFTDFYNGTISAKDREKEITLTTETSDPLNVKVVANVFSRVINPQRAAQTIGYDSNIEKMIAGRASAVLGAMIQSLPFNEIGQSHTVAEYQKMYTALPAYSESKSNQFGEQSLPNEAEFPHALEEKQKASSSTQSGLAIAMPSLADDHKPEEMMSVSQYVTWQLNKTIFHPRGIDIGSINIVSKEPADKESKDRLAEMSKQKMTTKTDAETAQQAAATALIQAESDKAVKLKLAEAEAKRTEILADAAVAAGQKFLANPTALGIRQLEIVAGAVGKGTVFVTPNLSDMQVLSMFGQRTALRRISSAPDLAAAGASAEKKVARLTTG